MKPDTKELTPAFDVGPRRGWRNRVTWRRERSRPLWRTRDPRRFRPILFATAPLIALVGLWLLLSFRNFYNVTRVVPRKDASVALYGTTPRDSLLWTLTTGLLSRLEYYDESVVHPFEELRLWIDRDKLRDLVADLPESARRYQPGFLLDGGQARSVEIRYRGDMPSNWLWPTKSWRVKLRKNDASEGYRLINLKTVPRELGGFVSDLVIEKTDFPFLGQKIVRLYVNNEYKGLFRQFRQVNESYVRHLGFMPGDVFVGENIGRDYLPGVYGSLFANAWYWSKSAENNHNPSDHRPHLEDLLDDLASYSYESLYRIVDYDNVVDAWALCNLIGNARMNNVHNWRLYFDPLDGRFKFLLYDAFFGKRPPGAAEVVPSQPFYVWLRDPKFVAAVNRSMLQFLKSGVLEQAADELDLMAEEVASSSLSEAEFVEAVREYAAVVRERQQALDAEIGQAELLWTQQGDRLTIYHKGLLPAVLERVEFAPSGAGASLRQENGSIVFPTGDDDGIDAAGSRRIYPGRAFVAGFKKRSAWSWARPVFGRADYRIESREGGRATVSAVSARLEGLGTTLQGRRVDPDEAESLELDTLSVNPVDHASAAGRIYRFQGDQRLREDLIVGEQDRLLVAPGTRFVLDEGVSVVIRSQVDLTDVEFTGDPTHPWGVVALHGPGADGSRIKRCRFEYGSKDTIAHVTYSGMLSIHHVPHATVEESRFGPNMIADDALRVGASAVDLLDSEFVNARSDAVDYDLSTGTIAGNRFVDSGNDAIDLMTSRVQISGNHVSGSGDKGISIGERSHPVVRDNLIEGCVTGIEIKDGSLAMVTHNVLLENETGVRLYWKNWRYAVAGRGLITRSIFSGNGQEVEAERRSRLILNASAVEGRFAGDSASRMRTLDLVDSSPAASDLRAALRSWVPARGATLSGVFESLGLSYETGPDPSSALEQPLPDGHGTFADYLVADTAGLRTSASTPTVAEDPSIPR